MSLDSALFMSINGSATSPHWLTLVALFATQHLPQWIAGGMAAVFVAGNRQVTLRASQALFAMAVAWLLASLGRHFIDMNRPFTMGLGTQWLPHAASHGFPSTHATVAFAFATAVALTAGRLHWALLALAAAALAAWSRVYLGLHFPSDVLAGALGGIVCGWLVCRRPFWYLSKPHAHAAKELT